jgi:hypothetical protein
LQQLMPFFVSVPSANRNLSKDGSGRSHLRRAGSGMCPNAMGQPPHVANFLTARPKVVAAADGALIRDLKS